MIRIRARAKATLPAKIVQSRSKTKESTANINPKQKKEEFISSRSLNFVLLRCKFMKTNKNNNMSQQNNNQTLDVNETLAKSEAFVIKYKKQIITAVVALIVVVGGTFAYIYGYSKPREEKAQELLGIVMQKYIMAQDFEGALKGEGKTMGLTKIAEKYGSTDAGNLAKYQAGLCNYQLGKTKEAIKYLEDYDTKGDETVSSQALSALANAYASDKQYDKSVDAFKKAAKATDVPALCAQHLFNAAVILESQKKNDEALKLLQEVKAEYPTAPICSQQEQNGVMMDAIIDKYIERLSK